MSNEGELDMEQFAVKTVEGDDPQSTNGISSDVEGAKPNNDWIKRGQEPNLKKGEEVWQTIESTEPSDSTPEVPPSSEFMKDPLVKNRPEVKEQRDEASLRAFRQEMERVHGPLNRVEGQAEDGDDLTEKQEAA